MINCSFLLKDSLYIENEDKIAVIRIETISSLQDVPIVRTKGKQNITIRSEYNKEFLIYFKK